MESGGLQICLVDIDGCAILHRIFPFVEPNTANCQAYIDTYGAVDYASRFQFGQKDVDCFRSATLNSLAGLLVGPESGTLYLQDIEIWQEDGRIDRFVCNDLLGTCDLPGCWLQAVKPGNVVLASGEQVSKQYAEELKQQSLLDYKQYKRNSLQLLGFLVALTTALIYFTADVQSAEVFLFGGLLGGVAQLQIQSKIDQQLDKGRSQGSLSTEVITRLLLVAGGFYLIQSSLDERQFLPWHGNQMTYLLFGLLGFSMNKISLAVVALFSKDQK